MRPERSTSSRAVACLLALVCASRSLADGIDDYIHTVMEAQRIPGLALAVVRNGKPLKMRGYGLANVELNARVSTDTVFRISSISKQFLATAIVLLAQDGRLALDDHVNRYLEDSPEAWAPITIRHLLTHISGLRQETPRFDPLAGQSNAELIRNSYGEPVLFKPGEKFAYSNLAYDVLGEIIEKAAGRPWPEFLRERIFAPLEMTATRAASLTDVVSNRAAGYVFRDDTLTNARPLITLRVSGSLLASLGDMVKWNAALSERRLIRSEGQQLMWTPVLLPDGSSTNYGLGWWIDSVQGHRRIRHGGDNPGYASEYSRFDDSLSVIVLTNGGCARPESIALDVADHFIPGLSPPRSTIKLDAEALAKYSGRYQFGPNDLVTIKAEGGGLGLQNDTPAFSSQCKMLAESPTTFFIARNESWVFTLKNGAATQVTVKFGDQEFPATKVQ